MLFSYQGVDYTFSGHGVKFLLMRSADDSNKQWYGFGIGGGVITDATVRVGSLEASSSSNNADNYFISVSANYEYLLDFGLGLNIGAGITPLFLDSTSSRTAAIGIGVSDLGVSYAFKKDKGFVLYANTDLMGVVNSGTASVVPFLWSIGLGLGYKF